MKKSFLYTPIFPWLLVLFFPVNYYMNNSSIFEFSSIYRTVFILFLMVLCGFGAVYALTKDVKLSSMLSTLPLLFILLPYGYSISISISLLAIFIFYPCQLTYLLNIFTVMLLLHAFYLIFLAQNESAIEYTGIEHSPLSSLKLNAKSRLKSKPNIIHIVLDGYASEQNLKAFMGYDNKDFFHQLNKLGFSVYEARAPYNDTLLSMGAVFYGDYVHKQPFYQLKDEQVRQNFASFMTNGIVKKRLKQAGYKIIFTEFGYRMRYPIDAVLLKGEHVISQFEENFFHSLFDWLASIKLYKTSYSDVVKHAFNIDWHQVSFKDP